MKEQHNAPLLGEQAAAADAPSGEHAPETVAVAVAEAPGGQHATVEGAEVMIAPAGAGQTAIFPPPAVLAWGELMVGCLPQDYSHAARLARTLYLATAALIFAAREVYSPSNFRPLDESPDALHAAVKIAGAIYVLTTILQCIAIAKQTGWRLQNHDSESGDAIDLSSRQKLQFMGLSSVGILSMMAAYTTDWSTTAVVQAAPVVAGIGALFFNKYSRMAPTLSTAKIEVDEGSEASHSSGDYDGGDEAAGRATNGLMQRACASFPSNMV